MTEASVIDASPLIHLCRAGYSSLLQTVAPVAIVPAPVAQEIRAKGPDDPAARVLASTSWLCEVPAQALPPALTSRRLGAGETAVLAWAAAKPNCIAVLDDLRARQLAILLGIRTTGTLGIVLLARLNGVIPEARTVIDRLIGSGMFLSRPVVDRALALVGE